MARLAKKEYVHNTGNKQMYYNSYSRKLIARTFSNFDVHFKTKLDFLTLSENYPTCTALTKYVFQETAYTWIISAISKYYASSLYKQYKHIIPPAKLLTSTILDTITDEEMTAVFEHFVENSNYNNKELEVNGQKVLLTTSQIAAVSLVYSLNNKIKISKEISYTIPEKAFVIVDAAGNQTEEGVKKIEHAAKLKAAHAAKDSVINSYRKSNAFKKHYRNTSNGLEKYNNRAQNMIVRLFSNFDIHFKDKTAYHAAIRKYIYSCKSLAEYFFGQDSIYTGFIRAISKYYGSDMYIRTRLLNPILDTITDDEMKTIFDYFAVTGGYCDEAFTINGKIEILTKYQIITTAMFYALKNKDVISEELCYDSPVGRFILRNVDGSKTKTCIEEEERKEMRQALKTDTQRKRNISKVAKPVVGEKIAVGEKSTVNTNVPKHAMKIDAIRNNIEKFACCVSAADEQDFKKTSDIIIAIMAAGAVSGDDTKNHDVADAVIKTSLKDKQHLVNMFEIIING